MSIDLLQLRPLNVWSSGNWGLIVKLNLLEMITWNGNTECGMFHCLDSGTRLLLIPHCVVLGKITSLLTQFPHCYGLNCVPRNSYVEALTIVPPNMTIFGDRAFT